MLTVPLQPVPSQQTKVVLNGQNCQLSIYIKGDWLFADLNTDGVDTFTGAMVRDAVSLNPCHYAAFSGDLRFIDTQGNEDPTYDGLGSRFVLVYFTEGESAILFQ